MRWFIAFLLILGGSLFGGYIFLKGYPYRLYSHWISGQDWNKYYSIMGYKKQWLAPDEIEDVQL